MKMKSYRLNVENVQGYMYDKGYDNKSLSLALGHSGSYMTNALSGRKLVSERTLKRLSELLGAPRGAVIDGVHYHATGKANKKTQSPIVENVSVVVDSVKSDTESVTDTTASLCVEVEAEELAYLNAIANYHNISRDRLVRKALSAGLEKIINLNLD